MAKALAYMYRFSTFCPSDNQIVTAVVLHFEAGKEPRSLTGIGLKCRNVGGVYVLPENRGATP